MLEKLRIILLLGTCIWTFADSATTFSYNPLTRVVTEEGAQCTKEGLMCDSCVHVSECISIGCNTFIREPVTTCIDSYCNIATGNCSTIPNPQCDPDIVNYVHRCLQIGLFPHPYNRCLYLMCPPGDDGTVLPEARVLRCGDGYAFDPYTTLCRVKLPDDTCPMLIQPCAFPTQRGAIPHNPHMFYICLTNHQSHAMPQMFVCPRSQVYNETKRACEEVVQDTGLNAAGKCQGRGLFYDPTSCFSYNECNDIIDSAPIKRTCASKMYFNEKLVKCVDFTCAQLSQL